MDILSHSNCFAFLILMDMPEHIVRHSIQVSRVAGLVASHLASRFNGELTDGDVYEIVTAGLIHDITKPRSFYTGEKHAETGGALLDEMGLPSLAEMVRRHVVLASYEEDELDLKAAIVNYADRRVMHDKVVSLEERMNYSMENYGRTPELRAGIRRLWDLSDALEAYLFKDLPFSPQDLGDMEIFHTYDPEFREYEEVLRRMDDGGVAYRT